jgi:hypothetical protein
VLLTISRVKVGWGKDPTHPGAGGVLQGVADHIRVRSDQGKRPNHSWVGGVLVCFTREITGNTRLLNQ